jgi:hypothetical protein
LLSLSRSPAVGPWGIPDAPAPDDDCDEGYRLAADVDEDEAPAAAVVDGDEAPAAAVVDGDEAPAAAVVDGDEAELVDDVELELEPHPAITSAPSTSAPVTSRRTDLLGIAMSIVWSFRSVRWIQP